jgi:hypothetical protein
MADLPDFYALREKFNPWKINLIPLVKFSSRLDLEQICLFLGRQRLNTSHKKSIPIPTAAEVTAFAIMGIPPLQ